MLLSVDDCGLLLDWQGVAATQGAGWLSIQYDKGTLTPKGLEVEGKDMRDRGCCILHFYQNAVGCVFVTVACQLAEHAAYRGTI